MKAGMKAGGQCHFILPLPSAYSSLHHVLCHFTLAGGVCNLCFSFDNVYQDMFRACCSFTFSERQKVETFSLHLTNH